MDGWMDSGLDGWMVGWIVGWLVGWLVVNEVNISFRHCFGHIGDRQKPVAGDNPLIYSINSNVSFRCTQP